MAKYADFPIVVNGQWVENESEEYPIIIFRDVTYFPMTWRFAVTEFNWTTSWEGMEGFSINIRSR